MLLADAPFYAPLKNTLALTSGDGTPTFSRSTVATIFDNENKLVTLAANVPRFAGARRVENLIDNTTLPTVTTGTGTVSVSNGVYTLDNSIPSSFTLYRWPGSNVAGTQYRATLQYRRISGSLGLTVDISDIGTTVNNPPDGNWYTYTTPVATVNHASTRWFDLQVGANTVYEVKLIQLENVTGQADQTMSEFVAGTQWFATNKDGSAILDANLLGCALNYAARTNNLLWCRDLTRSVWASNTQGSEILTNPNFDSNISGWSNGSDAGGSISWNASGYINLTAGNPASSNKAIAYQAVSLVLNEWYTLTFNRVNACRVNVGTAIDSGFIYASANEAGTLSITFKASAATIYISLKNSDTVGTVSVNSVSLKLATVNRTLNQIGIDGAINACTLLTATAADATILQSIVAAATAASSSFYVKRSVGSGTIYFTRDGGTTWTDVTSQLSSSTFTRVKIENTSVTNPVVGFKIATAGDAIIVDYGQNEAGTKVSMPILASGAAATRNADVLNYPSAVNYSSISGTVICEAAQENWAASNGSVIGSTTTGLFLIGTNSGVQLKDGTNSVNGPAGAVNSRRKIGYKYSGSTMKAFAGGAFGSPGAYDGAWNLTNIGIAIGEDAFIRDLAIWTSELSDADMVSVASDQRDITAIGTSVVTPLINFLQNSTISGVGQGNGSFAANFKLLSDATEQGQGLMSLPSNFTYRTTFGAAGQGLADLDAYRIIEFLAKPVIKISEPSPVVKVSYNKPVIKISP